MVHVEATTIPGNPADIRKLTNNKVRAKRPLNVRDLVWDRFQSYGQVFLSTTILLTLAFLFLIAMPKLFADPEGAPIFKSLPQVNSLILVLHALTALPPLMIGMLAFSKKIRNASLKWHRWMGTTYCICIWISALLGIMLAIANPHGPVARFGFGLLGLGWYLTTLYAYTTARAKDIVSHRRWMIRSFALTLAVVTVRPLFLMDPPFGLEFETWYLSITWLCWVPNLIIGEIYLRATKPNGKLKSQPIAA